MASFYFMAGAVVVWCPFFFPAFVASNIERFYWKEQIVFLHQLSQAYNVEKIELELHMQENPNQHHASVAYIDSNQTLLCSWFISFSQEYKVWKQTETDPCWDVWVEWGKVFPFPYLRGCSPRSGHNCNPNSFFRSAGRLRGQIYKAATKET